MKWIKENWFRICLLIVILIVGLTAVYLMNQNNKQLSSLKTREDLAQNQASCAQMQGKIVAEVEQNGDPLSTITAKNHYNSKLNKCFVEIAVTTLVPDYVYSIYDAAEDNKILSCLDSTKGILCLDERGPDNLQGGNPQIDQHEFDILEKEYMTE